MINGTLVAEKMTELGERNVNDFAKDGILIKPFRQNLADHFTETFFVRLQCQAYKLGIIDNLSQDYDVETIDYLVSEIIQNLSLRWILLCRNCVKRLPRRRYYVMRSYKIIFRLY